MGTSHVPQEAVLFVGILYNVSIDLSLIDDVLGREFGRILLKSAVFPFTESDYYAEEMGSPLRRAYIAFDHFLPLDRIVEIKHRSNRLEREVFSTEGRRNVNVDPGYLSSSKVVLATTKDYGHRIYLRDGIYAEVTLRYSSREKGFLPWEWTYRDYRRNETLRFFNELRAIYRGRAGRREG